MPSGSTFIVHSWTVEVTDVKTFQKIFFKNVAEIKTLLKTLALICSTSCLKPNGKSAA